MNMRFFNTVPSASPACLCLFMATCERVYLPLTAHSIQVSYFARSPPFPSPFFISSFPYPFLFHHFPPLPPNVIPGCGSNDRKWLLAVRLSL